MTHLISFALAQSDKLETRFSLEESTERRVAVVNDDGKWIEGLNAAAFVKATKHTVSTALNLLRMLSLLLILKSSSGSVMAVLLCLPSPHSKFC